jgi:hypothetical protein
MTKNRKTTTSDDCFVPLIPIREKKSSSRNVARSLALARIREIAREEKEECEREKKQASIDLEGFDEGRVC